MIFDFSSWVLQMIARALLFMAHSLVESHVADVICPKCGGKMERTPEHAVFCFSQGCEFRGKFFSPVKLTLFEDFGDEREG